MTLLRLTSFALLSLVALIPLFAAQPLISPKATKDEAKTTEEFWEVIYMGKSRIGFARTVIREFERNGSVYIQTDSESNTTLKRFGQTLKTKTKLRTVETADGKLHSFSLELQNPPAQSVRTTGIVKESKLQIESTTGGQKRTQTLKWDDSIRTTAYHDRQMQEKPLKPGESRAFKTFMPEFNRISTVTMTAGELASVPLLDGTTPKLLTLEVINSLFPTIKSKAYVDQHGESLKTDTGMMGIVSYRVPRKVAMEKIEGADLDLAVASLVKVGEIKKGHGSQKVVYRISMDNENPADYMVNGGTQSIRQINDTTIELTVTAAEMPEQLKTLQVKAEYLADTRFLQCRNRGVIEHAEKAAGEKSDPREVAPAMQVYVHKAMTNKNFSTAMASAAEVAKNLEGDCTEHAVLLAAMLRAKKIPSRIASGLVYIPSRKSMGGHMWTEALVGDQWIPLDATLGSKGVGAAHIKLAHSSFAEEGIAPSSVFISVINIFGRVKIEVIEQE